MSCYFQRGKTLRFEKAGPFRIQEIIGVGASSVVYRAINPEDHTDHLLKEFHPSDLPLCRDPADNLILMGGEREKRVFDFRLEQFKLGYKKQIELRKDAVLQNRTSNVQGIYSGYGTLFVDMTVFGGVTYEKIKNEENFVNLVKRIRAITEVVARYHHLGYLHLDIKPENIFVLTENCESVMFFDFDTVIAKSELKPGIILGKTEKYAAPELIGPDAFRMIGEWTDIYSIGMIFFQKLFGRLPDSHEQESGSNYDYRLPSGMLNDANDKVLELLTDFFRHTICRTKRFRWKSTREVLHALNQMLNAMQPVSKPVQENEDIRNVTKQISKLSKTILISAVLICFSIGFLALRKVGSNFESNVEVQPENNVQQAVESQPQTAPTLPEAVQAVTESVSQTEQQAEVIVPIISETVPTEEITPATTPALLQQNVAGNYVVETIANNMDAFRSMIVTNSGNVYYLDGSILHATNTADTLDLQTDFGAPLENGHLAYNPYQDIVYLLSGGSLSIYNITNFSEPVLVLVPDGFILHPSTGITPDIAVLPDHSLIIPASYDGSKRLDLETGKYSSFTGIYDLQSPYYAALAGDSIFMFREGETEASVSPLFGTDEKTITLDLAAPWNEAVASSGNKLWFYSDGIGVCEYGIDGSAAVRVAQQDISITDYQSLDYNNIWAVAANESGDFAFYDNSLASIRFIHRAS